MNDWINRCVSVLPRKGGTYFEDDKINFND